MLIDNTNIKKFNAALMEKNIQPSLIELDGEYLWLSKSLSPIFPKQKFKFLSIEIKLYVKGESESDVKNKLGLLIDKCKECNLKFEDDFYYKSFLINSNTENTLRKDTRKLNLSFIGYSYKEEATEVMNRITSKTINIVGNLETPAIVEITPATALADVTLEGLADDSIIIKNLTANKTVILDGELQKVTVDGVNKYGDTDMWDFPRLKPGANTIKVSKNNCDIKIKYKPRYI